MNAQVVDLFLTSFVGGCLGGIGIGVALYSHLKVLGDRHNEVKSMIADVITIKRMQKEIEELQKIVKHD